MVEHHFNRRRVRYSPEMKRGNSGVVGPVDLVIFQAAADAKGVYLREEVDTERPGKTIVTPYIRSHGSSDFWAEVTRLQGFAVDVVNALKEEAGQQLPSESVRT